jgi:two-component system, cell cycle response regulator DivK
MSTLSLSEQLSVLRGQLRLFVERTSDHNHLVEEFIQSAERDRRQAETAASCAKTAGVDQARRLLGAHVERTAAGAAAARQLSISARGQRAAVRRLLAELDDDRAGEHCPNAVLVVDDQGDVRELVTRVLTSAGFVVRTAANGLEGFIAAYELRPRVIVMDVTMPVLDGIEATRLIKAADATRAAQVIAHTGTPSFDGMVAQTLFAAVLEKPATPDVVLATVQRVARL